jgi:VWFA-related protein
MQFKGRAIIAVGLFLVSGFILAQGAGPNRNLGNNIPVQPAPDNSSSGPPRAGDISIDVNLVNMDVVVIDKGGNPIGGLEKRHFKVFDDNVEQKISNFTTVESPLTIVVIVEFTPFVVYYNNIYASVGGFVQSLRENDWAALVAYDVRPVLVTDFTRNKGLLYEGLQSLKIPTTSERGLFDAVYDTLQKLDKVDGKKAIFLLSTGLDSISRHTYGEALKKAQASDTMIYGVSVGQLFRLYNPGMSQEMNIELLAADNQLMQLAMATGGTTFLPRFDTEYPLIYDAISHQLRNQYNVAFIPTNQKRDGKFHKLRVEVENLDVNKDGKPDGLKAHARQGYYAPKP